MSMVQAAKATQGIKGGLRSHGELLLPFASSKK